jgi:hypothetical protein
MSRINDALKRAQAAQQSSSLTSDAPQLPAVTPEQTATRGIGLAVPFAFALIALLGLFLLWQIRQKRISQNALPSVAQSATVASSASATTPRPAAPSEAVVVSTPKVPMASPAEEKSIVQSPIPAPAAAHPVILPARPSAPVPPPLRLQAVLFSGPTSSAMINGQTVMAGDSVGGYRVSAIHERSVTLTSAKRTNILTLNQ